MESNLQWNSAGGEQAALLRCLGDIGRCPMLVSQNDWTWEGLFVAMQLARKYATQKYDWEKYVFLFDPHRAGFGQYGEDRPVATQSNKWEGSLGLIQFKRKGMVFKLADDHDMEDFETQVSCIPRAKEYESFAVRHFLEYSAVCNRCVKVATAFEILGDGMTYCLDCVNRFSPEFCNICNKDTGEEVMKIQLDGEIYTCAACRDYLWKFAL